MIRINLLPKELQQAARTPVKLFVTMISGIVVLALSVFAYGYLWFDVVVLEERVGRKHEEVKHLKANAAEVDSLLDDIQDYKRREQAIISIKTNRVLWSRKLDELAALTPRHIWILQLHMKEDTGGDTKGGSRKKIVEGTGGFLELVCISSGKEVQKVTNFRKKLKNLDEFYMNFIDEPIRTEAFYADFVNITQPEWDLVLLSNFKEPHNLKFTVRLDLHKPEFESSSS